MRYKYLKILPVAIAGMMLFSGCTGQTPVEKTPTATESSTDKTNSTKSYDDYFSTRDVSGEADTENAVDITLNDSGISASSDEVTISESTVTITKEGTYLFSGTLSDGNIIVNAGKDEKVQIVLKGVSITSKTFAPIYVAQADKVFVTLEEGTTNVLENKGSFTPIDDNNVDAVIFSKDDITLNGTGLLKITSPAGQGITGKDEVAITAGNYEINSSGTAIRANDSVAIADGTFSITTDADGIHAENKDDDSVGEVYIAGGTFSINAKDDGIHGTTTLLVDGGTYDITAAEGLEATVVTINDGKVSINASDDGINAAKKSSSFNAKVEINGGEITVVMGNGDTDGVDSNGDIIINGGTVNVTGNSTFDFDGEGTINGGTVIANGEEVTSLPNQMIGGPDGMGRPDGMGHPDGMDRPDRIGNPVGPNGPGNERGKKYEEQENNTKEL